MGRDYNSRKSLIDPQHHAIRPHSPILLPCLAGCVRLERRGSRAGHRPLRPAEKTRDSGPRRVSAAAAGHRRNRHRSGDGDPPGQERVDQRRRAPAQGHQVPRQRQRRVAHGRLLRAFRTERAGFEHAAVLLLHPALHPAAAPDRHPDRQDRAGRTAFRHRRIARVRGRARRHALPAQQRPEGPHQRQFRLRHRQGRAGRAAGAPCPSRRRGTAGFCPPERRDGGARRAPAAPVFDQQPALGGGDRRLRLRRQPHSRPALCRQGREGPARLAGVACGRPLRALAREAAHRPQRHGGGHQGGAVYLAAPDHRGGRGGDLLRRPRLAGFARHAAEPVSPAARHALRRHRVDGLSDVGRGDGAEALHQGAARRRAGGRLPLRRRRRHLRRGAPRAGRRPAQPHLLGIAEPRHGRRGHRRDLRLRRPPALGRERQVRRRPRRVHPLPAGRPQGPGGLQQGQPRHARRADPLPLRARAPRDPQRAEPDGGRPLRPGPWGRRG